MREIAQVEDMAKLSTTVEALNNVHLGIKISKPQRDWYIGTSLRKHEGEETLSCYGLFLKDTRIKKN